MKATKLLHTGVICPLVLIAICAIILPATAATGSDFSEDPATYKEATFILKSGEIFQDTEFTVDEEYKIIRLTIPDGYRNVSFGDIAVVQSGKWDITKIIIGRPSEGLPAKNVKNNTKAAAVDSDRAEISSSPSEENWISENDPKYISYNAAPWRLGLRLAGNYSLPTGDYYKGIDGGYGFEGSILIGLKRTTSLRLSVSQLGLCAEPDGILAPVDVGDIEYSIDWDMQTWRYVLEFQIQKSFNDVEGDLSLLYAYSGIGAIRHKLSADFVVNGTPGYSETTETKFIGTLGFGILKMISPTVGLDMSAELDVVFVGTYDNNSYSAYGNTQTSLLFDFKIGIVKLFK